MNFGIIATSVIHETRIAGIPRPLRCLSPHMRNDSIHVNSSTNGIVLFQSKSTRYSL